MNENKPPIYLVTGLIIGLGLGLVISMILFPARSGEGSPSQLSSEDRSIYRGLAAQAFSVDSNLQRASARLALLQDDDPAKELAAEAQRMLAEGRPVAEAEVLARLASALHASASSEIPTGSAQGDIPLFTPDPASATQGAALVGEDTPVSGETAPPPVQFQPSPSPAPTLGAPFTLDERKIICEPGQKAGLIEVQVDDQRGNPVPGVRIDISWVGGQEFFFSGLIPAVNPGFADFVMKPDEEYSLRVGDGGEQVRGVSIPECGLEDGGRYSGSVYLRFIQP